MVKVANSQIQWVINTLKQLRDDEYSLLWSLCDDIEVNGHIIKIKSSTMFCHIILDNSYVCIRNNRLIIDTDGTKYYDSLDYVKSKLEKGV